MREILPILEQMREIPVPRQMHETFETCTSILPTQVAIDVRLSLRVDRGRSTVASVALSWCILVARRRSRAEKTPGVTITRPGCTLDPAA